MNVETPHVIELIPAYALGCLDEDETEVVVAHLAHCSLCQQELGIYQGVVDDLPLALPLRTPSPAVKTQLMAHRPPPAATPTPMTWLQRVWVVVRAGLMHPLWRPALVVALLLVGIGQISRWQQSQTADPWTTIVLSPTDYAPQAQGLIVVYADERLGALIAEALPPLPPEQQYQLWLIEDGQRTSGAIFSVAPSGYHTLSFEAPHPLWQYSAFGITIEPAGGSPGPTGPRVLGHGL